MMHTDTTNSTQTEFEALIGAFSPYSTNQEIVGRLADTVKSLREVASESSTISRSTSTRKLDERTATRDDGLIADYAFLCREMQSNAALQSNALAEIQVSETSTARTYTSNSIVEGGAGFGSRSPARHAHGVWHHPHL